MKALILAAGYATRLYPLTLDRPKALLPVGGKPLMDHLIEKIVEIPAIDAVHIVTNHKFADHFAAWAEGARARYPGIAFYMHNDRSLSDEDKLGAVGDIAFGIRQGAIDDDLLVAASDNYCTFSLLPFVEAFKTRGRDTILAQAINDRALLKRFAVATLDDDLRVMSLVEKPDDPPSNIGVYALYLYRRDTLPLFEEYLSAGNPPDAPGHFPEWLIRRKEVGAYLFTGECVDIGTPESYAELDARLSSGG